MSYEELLQLLSAIVHSNKYNSQFVFWPNEGPSKSDLVYAGGLRDQIAPPQLVADIPDRLLERFHNFQNVGQSGLPDRYKTRFEHHQEHRARVVDSNPSMLQLVQLFGGGYQQNAPNGVLLQIGRSALPPFMYDHEGEQLYDKLLAQLDSEKLDSSSLFTSVHSISRPTPEPYVFEVLVLEERDDFMRATSIDMAKFRPQLAAYFHPNAAALDQKELLQSPERLIAEVMRNNARLVNSLQKFSSYNSSKYPPELYDLYWLQSNASVAKGDAVLLLFHIPRFVSQAAQHSRLQDVALNSIEQILFDRSSVGKGGQVLQQLTHLFQQLNNALFI